jgi:ankyrin repeat protein
MKTIEDVFRQCEKTGAWYGLQISDVNQKNDLGDTVLHTACSWGDLNAVKLLVAAGANVNSKGDQGAIPLFNAVIGKSPDVILFLISSGADSTIENDYKRQVLDYARNVSASSVILQLLEQGKKKGGKKGK